MPTPPLHQRLHRRLMSPRLKPWLEHLPLIRKIYAGWTRVHPFDVAHGIDTSGFVAASECTTDRALATRISPYVGSQPSIIRAALARLPEPEQYAFVDIGCGKGRPLVVASELPYQRVLGVELAAHLAQVGQANAKTIAVRYPERTPIEIRVGNACAVEAPATKVVYYMYHAFNRVLVDALVANLERQLGADLEHAFFVYYDPVHSAALDNSPCFARWSAQMIDYAADELGFGPDLADTVVIWQSRPLRYAAQAGAERTIAVDHRNWCTLVELPLRPLVRPLVDAS